MKWKMVGLKSLFSLPPPKKRGRLVLNKQKINPDKVEEFRICWIYNWTEILKRKRKNI